MKRQIFSLMLICAMAGSAFGASINTISEVNSYTGERQFELKNSSFGPLKARFYDVASETRDAIDYSPNHDLVHLVRVVAGETVTFLAFVPASTGGLIKDDAFRVYQLESNQTEFSVIKMKEIFNSSDHTNDLYVMGGLWNALETYSSHFSGSESALRIGVREMYFDLAQYLVEKNTTDIAEGLYAIANNFSKKYETK